MWDSAKLNPAQRHGLLFASFMARTVGAESGGFTVGWEHLCDCTLPPQASLRLEIWWQAEIAWPCRLATVYSASKGRGRGHVTVFTSSLTSCGWSPLAGIQWLHQTLLTPILSCPIGKAIKTWVAQGSQAVHDVFWGFSFLTDSICWFMTRRQNEIYFIYLLYLLGSSKVHIIWQTGNSVH